MALSNLSLPACFVHTVCNVLSLVALFKFSSTRRFIYISSLVIPHVSLKIVNYSRGIWIIILSWEEMILTIKLYKQIKLHYCGLTLYLSQTELNSHDLHTPRISNMSKFWIWNTLVDGPFNVLWHVSSAAFSAWWIFGYLSPPIQYIIPLNTGHVQCKTCDINKFTRHATTQF